MTDTACEIVGCSGLKSTKENTSLSDVIWQNLKELNAPQMTKVQQSAGSTDFGDVTQVLPGVLAYLAFTPHGTSAHSQGFLDAGKSEAAHDALVFGGKALAGACVDLIENPGLLKEICVEFQQRKS